jgi:hypothetical protein
MTKIPSIEKTDDFIYRFVIKRDSPLHDPDDPHLLMIDEFVGPGGSLHSIDMTVLRDGQRANDIEFRSFEHVRDPSMTWLKFKFRDYTNQVSEHEYLLTVILRYFI